MVCPAVQRCTSFFGFKTKPVIWTYPCPPAVGYTSIADNSGIFAKTGSDKRTRSTTATVERQNNTFTPKYLDDAIHPRHRFALLHEEAATKRGFIMAKGGADSEAITSPLLLQPKFSLNRSPPSGPKRDDPGNTEIHMPNTTNRTEAAADQFELVLRIQQSRGSHADGGARFAFAGAGAGQGHIDEQAGSRP